MPDINLTISLTSTQLSRLNKLRQYYNYAFGMSEDANGFATILIKEATHARWKEYHTNFFNILEAYATATDVEQTQVDAILGL